MAKRDASKHLGGMAGKAAGLLRSRQSQLDSAIDGATGSAPAKKKPVKKTTKKK